MRNRNKGFTAPSGKMYKSESAYKRSLRAMFANTPSVKKKHFPKTVYTKEKKLEHKKLGNTTEIKDVSTKNYTTVTIEPKEDKYGKTRLDEKKETYRVTEVITEDPQAGIIRTVTAEEAGRYTPATVEYEIEKLPGGIETVTAHKNERNISSSTTTAIPLTSDEVRKAQLLDDFMEWDRTKDSEKRLSTRELITLAKELDLPTGGGKLKQVQPTFEKRIREEIKKKNIIDYKLQRELDNMNKQESAVIEKVSNTDPAPPIHNFKKNGLKITEEDKNYFQKINDSKIEPKKREIFLKELQIIHEKVNKKEKRGGMVQLQSIRPYLQEKGYNRFQQDAHLMDLERKRTIELQIASDPKAVQDETSVIVSPARGVINYVIWR